MGTFSSHTSLTALTLHPLWHMIIVHMSWYLVEQQTCQYKINSVDTIDPLYNLDDYAKESKFRIELAHKRARLILDNKK